MKFYCQREIEQETKCDVQCDHCKEYYKPLEEKPYFCKYLPVEGELQEGDTGITRDGRVLPYDEIAVSSVIRTKDCKKVKLFLCSIAGSTKEGQRFFHPNNPSYTTLLPEGGLPLHEPFIGVVGEISPKATWIAEGDEFNENEWDMNTTLNRVEILCPNCKTCH